MNAIATLPQPCSRERSRSDWMADRDVGHAYLIGLIEGATGDLSRRIYTPEGALDRIAEAIREYREAQARDDLRPAQDRETR